MKKIITTTIAAGLVAGVAMAEVSTTFDLASAYVFRGVTLNDGAVFQPGIEASGFGMPEEYGGFAFGAWANYDIDNYNDNQPGSTVTETDWYASYSLPSFVDSLDLFVGYTEYMYGGGDRDEEINLGASYEIAGVGLGLTLYKGVGGLIGDQLYVEATAGYGMDFTEELSGSVFGSIGFMNYDQAVANSVAPSLEDGFHNYSIGADIGYALSEKWSAGASVTYIGQGDDAVLPEGVFGYDADVVGMIGVACDM
jgi:uncharacterized protein (TIGR02001 family)